MIEVFICLILFVSVIKFAIYISMKRFDSQLDKIRYMDAPLVIVHDGQTLLLHSIGEELGNKFPSTQLTRTSIYINEQLVLTMSRMRRMVFVIRSVDVNHKHSCATNIFKIIRQIRAGPILNSCA